MPSDDLATNSGVSGYASPTRAPDEQRSLASEGQSLLRNGFQQEIIDRAGRLTIDRRGHAARIDGSSIRLTAREFRLLVFLYERRGQALSREQVLESVWGDEYDGGRRTVDVHVRRLRAKLRELLPLETIRGVGYKLRDEA